MGVDQVWSQRMTNNSKRLSMEEKKFDFINKIWKISQNIYKYQIILKNSQPQFIDYLLGKSN